MLIKQPADIPSSEITSRSVYVNRRRFIQTAAGPALAVAGSLAFEIDADAQQPAVHGRTFATKPSPLSTSEAPNSWSHITTYNNFYEFGTNVHEPAVNARDRIGTGPWYNFQGEMIARDLAHLHGDTMELAHQGNNLNKLTGLTEKGQIVPGLYDYSDPRDNDWNYVKNTRFSSRHEMLTGTQTDGTAFTDAARYPTAVHLDTIWGYIGVAGLYGAGYAIFALAAGLLLFENRELGGNEG